MKYSGEKKKLVEVSELITRGITPAYTENTGVIVLNQKCIRGNRVNWKLSRLTDPEKRKISKDKQLQTYDILVNSTGVGTLGRVAQVKEFNINATVDSHVTIVRPKKNINPEFLGYSLYYQQANIENLAEGSTGQTELSRVNLGEQILINLLPLEVQNKTVRILSSIDKKIDNNNLLIEALESKLHLLFKHWFIDLEFPNEKGLPYKSSGGKMVESELGMIPEGWSVQKFKEMYSNYDRMRIPLSKREREKREKVYPYYGAASLMDYVDDYIFDGTYLLLGEDGTVINADGSPVLQYVWGKFWVNNHAHVLKGTNPYSTEYLYLLLKHTNVESIITGAVQKKISQSNLNSLNMIKPTDDIVDYFSKLIEPNFKAIKSRKDENIGLSRLRDTLLPKLLSGEIEVPVKEPESV